MEATNLREFWRENKCTWCSLCGVVTRFVLTCPRVTGQWEEMVWNNGFCVPGCVPGLRETGCLTQYCNLVPRVSYLPALPERERRDPHPSREGRWFIASWLKAFSFGKAWYSSIWHQGLKLTFQIAFLICLCRIFELWIWTPVILWNKLQISIRWFWPLG